MKSLVLRGLLSILFALTFTLCGIHISPSLGNVVFTVIGVSYSILIGMLVSFDASKLYNKVFKASMRGAVGRDMKWLSIDFSLVVICFILISFPSIQENKSLLVLGANWLANWFLILSLVYEVWNFYVIYRRNVDIQDRIMEEEIQQQETEINRKVSQKNSCRL